MKKIVIFGGTTEGRRLSRELSGRGGEIVVCVAREYGREAQGECPGVTVLTGPKDRRDMGKVLKGAVLCVNATHPYAVEAGANLRSACEDVSVPYVRLLRPASGTEGARVIMSADARDAAGYLAGTAGNILLTTGAKELPCFAALDPSRLFPRVLPARDSLSACEDLGIPRRNVIAMQGPFSRELNEALIRQFHIAYLVTKDGGQEGGFPEKARAARNTGIPLILLKRPEERGKPYEAVAVLCQEALS